MANTSLTLTVTVATKRIEVTGSVAFRETVDVTIVNLNGMTPTNLVVEVLDAEETIMAYADSFTASGDDAVGVLSLNTTPLQTFFADKRPRSERTFTLLIWDESDSNLLGNDVLIIQNNQFSAGTAPDPTPIADDVYVRLNPPNGSFRVKDKQHWQEYDPGTGLWRTVFISQGGLALGPGEV